MKIFKSKFIASLACLLFSQSLLATLDSALKSRLSSEMDYIGSIYEQYYAPKNWKETHVAWNLTQEINLAKQGIHDAQSVNDYRQAVVRFFNSMQDYHVGYSFVSTEKASLPILLKTVQGKTLIIEIDRNKLSATSFPYKVGDEVLAMDEIPVNQLRSSLTKDMKSTAPLTDQALGDMFLTSRRGQRNQLVPRNTVTLTLLRAGESIPRTHQLNWEYTAEQIPGAETLPSQNQFNKQLSFHGHFKLAQAQMLSPVADMFAQQDNFIDSPYGLGNKKPFLPDFGPRVWETDATNTFDAYIYQNETSQLIGVIRIASYSPNSEDPKGREKAVADFSEILKKMQKLTSGLVIDQTNNPGGSIFYLYSLVSMLTDQAFYTPKHRMSIDTMEVKPCVEFEKAFEKISNDEEARKLLGESDDGFPVNYEYAVAAKNYCQFMVTEFKQGKKITEPFYIFGVDKVNPSPVAQYLKPIVILVNELDFSGGDFFPATLQDNKRVTVVGTRTSGAGGYVKAINIPNLLGLERFTLTGSIAERIDKNPIENLGVTPDVPLEMTIEDYRDGFKHYISEVKKVLTEQIRAF